MTPGSSSGRMIAGEFGLGHAVVQVEGKMTDAKTHDTIATFGDLRQSSGMIGLQDLAGDAGADLVRDMLEDIGADVMKEIQEDFHFEKIYLKTNHKSRKS